MNKSLFWKTKQLQEMSKDEWESLCDGCGYCCLVKLQDEDTNALYVTNVTCRLLDTGICRCRDYSNRTHKVEKCLVLSADKPELFKLLPVSCAYRRLHAGLDLPDWHPLVSGDPDSVRNAGISVCDYAISEEYIHPDQLEDHIIHQLGDE